MASDKPEKRGVLKTLLGLRQPIAQAPRATESTPDPEPPTSVVPDSVGLIAQECLAQRAHIVELERQLAASNAACTDARSAQATAVATREQTQHDLERERAEVGELRLALDGLVTDSSDEALQYYRRRVSEQSGRIRDLERHIKQGQNTDAVQELQRAVSQLTNALATTQAALEKITGKSLLSALDVLSSDPDACQQITDALSARGSDPATSN